MIEESTSKIPTSDYDYHFVVYSQKQVFSLLPSLSGDWIISKKIFNWAQKDQMGTSGICSLIFHTRDNKKCKMMIILKQPEYGFTINAETQQKISAFLIGYNIERKHQVYKHYIKPSEYELNYYLKDISLEKILIGGRYLRKSDEHMEQFTKKNCLKNYKVDNKTQNMQGFKFVFQDLCDVFIMKEKNKQIKKQMKKQNTIQCNNKDKEDQ